MKKSMKYCVLTAAILAASSVSYADRDSDDRSIEDRLGDDIVELLNDYDDAALANIAINEADLDASVTIDADNLSLDAVGSFGFEGLGEIAINRISTNGLGVANTGGIALAMESYSEVEGATLSTSNLKNTSSDWATATLDFETSSEYDFSTETETEIDNDSWSIAEMESSSEMEFELEIDDDVTTNSSMTKDTSKSFDVAINADGMFGLGEQANGSFSADKTFGESRSNFESDYNLEKEFEFEEEAFAMAEATTDYDLEFETETDVESSSSLDLDTYEESFSETFATSVTLEKSYDYSSISTEISVAAMNVAYNTAEIDSSIALNIGENILGQNIDFATSATGSVLSGDISIGFDPKSVIGE